MDVRLNLRTVTVSSGRVEKQEALQDLREHILRVQKESQQEPAVSVYTEQEKHVPRLSIKRRGKPESVLRHRKLRRNLQRKCAQNTVVELQGKGQREPTLNVQGEGQRDNSLYLQGNQHQELKSHPHAEERQEPGVHRRSEGQCLPGLPGQGLQEPALHQQRYGQEESGRGVLAKGRQQHSPSVKKRRGRPSLEPDEAKRRREQRQKERRKNTVNLGKSHQEWAMLKNSLSYKKDADFAAFLLNFYRRNNNEMENQTAPSASSQTRAIASPVASPIDTSVPSSEPSENAIDSTGLILKIKQEETYIGEWEPSTTASHPIFHPGLSLWIKEVDESGASNHENMKEEKMCTAENGNIRIKKEGGVRQTEESGRKYKRNKANLDKDTEKYMKVETTFTGSKTLFCLKSMKISKNSKPERTEKKSHNREINE
ncbi:hypothetical protein NDU88_003266 [Pleurodeles waltl]|uniref:Uncharacterized protein n=1 Tax=Pleurodeles waltl TaxID=8319 RepID=A0AAV7VCV8_PLEWA|nr:hypothetical protein NDU88_003266 [Pleurodeles waltl]